MSNEQATTPLFTITGRVEQEYHVRLDELQSMDRVTASDLLIACGSGDPKRRVDRFSGVLLSDVINRTAVITREHNDTKKMFVVVASDDGYQTVFSWQELFNTEVGGGVMVLLEQDGQSIFAKRGCVDLCSSRDFLTGPRYLKRLKSVQIRILEEL